MEAGKCAKNKLENSAVLLTSRPSVKGNERNPLAIPRALQVILNVSTKRATQRQAADENQVNKNNTKPSR